MKKPSRIRRWLLPSKAEFQKLQAMSDRSYVCWFYPELKRFPADTKRGWAYWLATSRVQLSAHYWLLIVVIIAMVFCALFLLVHFYPQRLIYRVPFYLIPGVAGPGSVLLFHKRVQRSLRHQLNESGQAICMKCGYNLTGNVSGVCPECGTPCKPDMEGARLAMARRSEVRRVAKWAGVVLSCLTCLLAIAVLKIKNEGRVPIAVKEVAFYLGAFLLALTLTAYLWWRDRPFPRGKCHVCGYNLTGNVSGVCPECGTPVLLTKDQPDHPFTSAYTCRQCGCDLTDRFTGRCPECGASTPKFPPGHCSMCGYSLTESPPDASSLLPVLRQWFCPMCRQAHALRYPSGHCQSCGYNLTGADHARCPECGTGV